jgi:hypothetical protein
MNEIKRALDDINDNEFNKEWKQFLIEKFILKQEKIIKEKGDELTLLLRELKN